MSSQNVKGGMNRFLGRRGAAAFRSQTIKTLIPRAETEVTNIHQHSNCAPFSRRKQFPKLEVPVIEPRPLRGYAVRIWPDLYPTLKQGTVVSWKKKEGDQVREGDLLCEIETDFAFLQMETPKEGYLAKIVIREGERVGKLFCIIVKNQKDVAKFKDYVDDIPGAETKVTKIHQNSNCAHFSRRKQFPKLEVPAKGPQPLRGYGDYSTYPSHVKVAWPALQHGTVVSWEKKEGDQLRNGDLLCEIDMDFAILEMETPEEGYLAKIVTREGERAACSAGKLFCIIVENQEDVAKFKDYVDDSSWMVLTSWTVLQ